jgi:hypothetical protein
LGSLHPEESFLCSEDRVVRGARYSRLGRQLAQGVRKRECVRSDLVHEPLIHELAILGMPLVDSAEEASAAPRAREEIREGAGQF